MRVVAGVASRALADVLLGPDRRGTVIGALRSAVHVSVGADVVALVTADAVLVPNAVALATSARDRPLAGVVAGQALTMGRGRLEVGPVHVEIVRWFEPRPSLPDIDTTLIATRTRRLKGLLPPIEPVIAERVEELRTAVTAPDAAATRRAAQRLVGLGSGLTPAGDDVVAGALAAAVLLGASRESVAALDLAEPRTTTFSASLLRHAARGEVPPQVARLLAALCGRGDVGSAARDLVAIGHSSGAALAAGVAVGATAAMGAGPASVTHQVAS